MNELQLNRLIILFVKEIFKKFKNHLAHSVNYYTCIFLQISQCPVIPFLFFFR